MVWNELKNNIIKRNIILEKNLPILNKLNNDTFAGKHLAKDSYVAVSGKLDNA